MQLLGKRIFIVEDNPLNRVVYQITLGVNGAHLEFDRWGKDALDRLQWFHDCNLVILDLMLSKDASGFDIFQEIRAIPTYDDIPIIAISASEPSVALPKAREMGFNGFIAKPIDEAKITDQVLKVINGEQIWYDGLMHHE